MKCMEMNKNRKMEIMSLFPLLGHLLYCPLHQLQISATQIKRSPALRFKHPVVTDLTVYTVVYCLSSGTMHAVCSVKLHVDRMFEKRTEGLRSA